MRADLIQPFSLRKLKELRDHAESISNLSATEYAATMNHEAIAEHARQIKKLCGECGS